jgi:pimeloyl-ACP methyl ester carboxylesterase
MAARRVVGGHTIGGMVACRFDVGGYEVAAEVAGEGAPAVVFSSGLGDGGEVWAAVLSALESPVRVVRYARGGVGGSDAVPGDRMRSLGAAAEELRRLLDVARVGGPYVLVGHSIGAVIAEAFAARWGEDLAGVVLVDPSDIGLWFGIEEPRLRLDDGERQDCASFDLTLDAQEILAARRPLGVPGVVISSRVGRWLEVDSADPWRPYSLEGLEERWQRGHRELAAVLGATRKSAEVGGHYVHTDEPELVAGVIDELTRGG